MPKLKARVSVVRTPKHRSVQRVQLDGIISSPTIERFRKIMDKAVEAGRDVVLDLKGISYVNSSGLAEFVRIHDALEQKNLSFIIVNLDTEVKRLVLMSDGDVARMVQIASETVPSERELLLQALMETGWNRRRSARRLGVNESTVRKRIEKYNLLDFQPK